MKLYLAGRFPIKKEIGKLGEELEKCGIEITTKWWDIEQTHSSNRSVEESTSVGTKELFGIVNADVVIAIIDDKDYAYRGTLTELGIALGNFYEKGKCIKKSIFFITGKEFSNKNCGIMCVPHIYLATISNIIDTSDLSTLAPKIIDMLKDNM